MVHEKNLSIPRVGKAEEVYRNKYQHIYKIQLNFESHSKEVFVTDYGQRAGVVVEGGDGVLLTRQYRHLIDKVSWEIPGGKVDPQEGVDAAARRECLEETGILCGELKSLLIFQPGLDTLCNPTYIFYTRIFHPISNPHLVHDEEVCGHEWVPMDKCLEMIKSGIIVDSLSVIALLSYNTFILANKHHAG